MVIEGELVAKSTGTVSEFSLGDRVFHQKFGYGNVVKIDGNKLIGLNRDFREEGGVIVLAGVTRSPPVHASRH